MVCFPVTFSHVYINIKKSYISIFSKEANDKKKETHLINNEGIKITCQLNFLF